MRLGVAWLVVLAVGSVGSAAAPAVRVAGPRETSLARPAYRFTFPGAIGFRCAFDTMRLHRCAARYSERLRPGIHYLRVRAELSGGKLSATTLVRVAVGGLVAGKPIMVGRGPGVPSAGAGGIWVPTLAGTLVRIDPASGGVATTVSGLPSTPDGVQAPACATFAACWFMDAALVVGGDVWVASDFAGSLERVDAGIGRVVQTIAVSPRPGGLAAGGGFLWAFHTLSPVVSRLDPTTGAVTEATVPGAEGAGIAYARGAVWLLSSAGHGEVYRLDPATLAITARVPLEPIGRLHPLKEAWSLVTDGDSLWAASPNYNLVTKLEAARATVVRRVRTGAFSAIPEQPFGLALGSGDLWTSGRSGVGRFDAASGRLLGAVDLPTAGSGYASIAYGFGAAWATNFDRGTITRIALSQAAG